MFWHPIDFNPRTGKLRGVDFIARNGQHIFGENVYDQLAQRYIYNYLDKYKNEMEDMFVHQKYAVLLKPQPGELKDCVFTMWWQGLENAPDVVKACISSLKKINKKVVVITKDNIKNYVLLPNYIWEKYEKGMICLAHLSDIVRVYLLAVYGGTWVDSTVYIATPVPDYMTQGYFVFKQSPQLRECRSYGNWWISAPVGHEIIIRQLAALLVYWKHENAAYDYYIFHILWRKILDEHNELKVLTDRITDRITDSTHLLMKRYACIFDENEWEQMKAISPVFKCTYKAKGLGHIDSYYMRLCREMLP